MLTEFKYKYKNLSGDIIENFNITYDTKNDTYIYSNDEFIDKHHTPFEYKIKTEELCYNCKQDVYSNGSMKVYLHVFKFDISDLFVCAIFPCLIHNVELQKYGTYKFIYNDEYYKFYLNKTKDVLYCIMTYKTNDEIFTYKFTLSLFNNGKLEHKSISYYISDLRLAIIYNIYNIFTNRDFYNNDQFIQNEDYIRHTTSLNYKNKYLTDEVARLQNFINYYEYKEKNKNSDKKKLSTITDQYNEINRLNTLINYYKYLIRNSESYSQIFTRQSDQYELYIKQLNNRYNKKIKNIQSEYDELKTKYSECKKNNDKLTDKYANYIKTIDELNKKIESIETKLQQLTSSNKANDANNSIKDKDKDDEKDE